MVMPWIDGKSWFECLMQSKDGTFALTKQQSLALARNLYTVLGQLERRGLEP